MKAIIYYNKLKHPATDRFAHKLWIVYRKDPKNQILHISDTEFDKNWTRLPVKEEIGEIEDINESLEEIYRKYNLSSLNPYSNDPGQKILRNLNVRHTSMMMGDIIEIDNTYYLVVSTGFLQVSIE